MTWKKLRPNRKSTNAFLLLLIIILLLIFFFSNSFINFKSFVSDTLNKGSGSSLNDQSGGGGGVSSEEPSSDSCRDTDGGYDPYKTGYVFYNGIYYYDQCLEVGEVVREYACINDIPSEKNIACDYGEECYQTRSGGYCRDIPNSWSAGDVVFQGGGTGTITGSNVNIATLDLNELGFTSGGTCRLGAQIQTSWSYLNADYCQGLQGAEGVEWKFYDSNGLEYSRIDSSPMGLGVDLHPESHILEWDGVTNWKASVEKVLNLPDCQINYEYSIKIYVYDC